MIERINRFNERLMWSLTLREIAMFTGGATAAAALFFPDPTSLILMGWAVIVFVLVLITGFLQNRSPKSGGEIDA